MDKWGTKKATPARAMLTGFSLITLRSVSFIFLFMLKPDKDAIWKEVLNSVRVSVSTPIFNTWISQTHLDSLRKLDQKRYMAEIGCNSTFVKATVEQRYFGLLQDALIKALGSHCDMTFVIKADPTRAAQKMDLTATLFEEKEMSEQFLEKVASSRLRPGFTFEYFAVSGSNQMAWAAADAVANRPGTAYNPLVIWGGVGVGKTHLMHAVGHTLLSKDLSLKILACTAEDFTNDIVEGIRNKSMQKVREKYRKLDALFIDDIQFIAGKDTAQEEFFHTFNTVTLAGGQIILTSDRPPHEIEKLEDRLKSRFEAGMIVDIAQPDFELRCAIVQIKSEEKGLQLASDMVQLIAGNVETARKIEGFLTRLGSEVKLKNTPVTEELVKSVIQKSGGAVGQEVSKKLYSTDAVIDAVCKHYNISKRSLLGEGRTKMIAQPRQVLMYILRIEMGLPFEEVGRLLGGRDHTTIMHGVEKITALASTDIHIREDISGIKAGV